MLHPGSQCLQLERSDLLGEAIKKLYSCLGSNKNAAQDETFAATSVLLANVPKSEWDSFLDIGVLGIIWVGCFFFNVSSNRSYF